MTRLVQCASNRAVGNPAIQASSDSICDQQQSREDERTYDYTADQVFHRPQLYSTQYFERSSGGTIYSRPELERL